MAEPKSKADQDKMVSPFKIGWRRSNIQVLKQTLKLVKEVISMVELHLMLCWPWKREFKAEANVGASSILLWNIPRFYSQARGFFAVNLVVKAAYDVWIEFIQTKKVKDSSSNETVGGVVPRIHPCSRKDSKNLWLTVYLLATQWLT